MNEIGSLRRAGHTLITGAAGFIGSELARQVVATRSHVILVDNLVNGKADNVADLLGPRACLETVDIRDEDEMGRLLDGVDTVYHLACLGVRHSIHSPDENHEVNAGATLSLLRLAHDAGVGRFVYVSSSEIYGTARTVPMTEDHPAFPHTVYGASKLAGECYARAYHDTYGFSTVIVRPFNSFGPRSHHEGDCGEVIPKFLLRCMAGRPLIIFGDGTQTRDFTYVADTAAGIFAAGIAPAAVGQTLNVGQGREIMIKELATRVAQVVGRDDVRVEHVAARPGDVLRLCADTSRARKLLGLQPQIGLREGLDRLKSWYERQGKKPEELLRDETERNWILDSELKP